ncbi:MAG: hypothetical protein M3Y68_08265, partial [Chloroflexota bacterium]|nr:hypothetical protein [Chloroflexota bacterium]
MNAIRKNSRRLPVLLGMLLLHSMLIGVLVLTGAQPVEAGPSARKTRTPRPTATQNATHTPTSTPASFPTP